MFFIWGGPCTANKSHFELFLLCAICNTRRNLQRILGPKWMRVNEAMCEWGRKGSFFSRRNAQIPLAPAVLKER
jgi:hypothetical protein